MLQLLDEAVAIIHDHLETMWGLLHVPGGSPLISGQHLRVSDLAPVLLERYCLALWSLGFGTPFCWIELHGAHAVPSRNEEEP